MEQKNAANPGARPTTPVAAPKATETAKSSGGASLFSVIAIIAAFILSQLIFNFVLGDNSRFKGGDHNLDPLPGDYLATMYKGGVIVPFLLTMFLCVIIFAIERALTIAKAKGSKSIESFVRSVRQKLNSNDINGAIALCDQQKGSVANVVRAGLMKYKEMGQEHTMNTDQRVLAIQKEIEESTALELPMLEKNLVIISTIASVATLTGLLGTVFGMIKAFAALAQAGNPDATALASGISEALINTALGIGTSALAIIGYNYFTSKIDELTYSIDEAGFSIIQTFAAQHGSKGQES
jgi:biopolymer transport protein ExbB